MDQLPEGTLVVSAEVAPPGTREARLRIAAPAGWVDGAVLRDEPAISRETMDFATFSDQHQMPAAGDHYGIVFPIDLEGLRVAGSDFLTDAFRAAGTIAADNRVTAIVSLDLLGIPGASQNALLTVAYARDEPGLSPELFVKFPPADVHHKFGLLRMFDGEIELARLARERPLPVVTCRCHFADYAASTGNYILITDRVPNGVPPLQPAYRKGYDHDVPSIEEHYEVLTRNLAGLVAAHKRGALGHDIERRFPFARAARDFTPIVDPEPRLDRLIDFIGRVAPQLFDPEVTGAAFLQRWREDVLFGLAHKDALIRYLMSDVDYTGFCHVNLNVDNAWFWRDEAGALHAGLLDWGGAGQASLGQALSGMMMMLQPDAYLGRVRRMIGLFVEELARQGGPRLDREELRFQFKASLYSTAIFMFVTILAGSLDYFPEDYFSGMKDRMDVRLLEGGFYSAVVWIDNILQEWLEDVTPGDACRAIVAGRTVTPARTAQGGRQEA